MILALDTTSESGSLALVDASGVIAEQPMTSPDGFGHVLFGQLQAFLQKQGVPLGQIDCFAAAAGPGSFTGVRVGLAAIKGLAEATGKPAIGVSNLQAMAYYGTAPLRAVVLDARRGEVYGALYDGRLKLVGAETVSNFADWLASLPAGPIEFITTYQDPALRAAIAPGSLAAAVGYIARNSDCSDPAALDANYVRRSDAEILSAR